MSCSSKSLNHVVKFDGTNLPLWKLGLDVALEEHDVQSVTDGTCAIPAEVYLLTYSKPCITHVHLCLLKFAWICSTYSLPRRNNYVISMLQIRAIIQPVEGAEPGTITLLGPVLNSEQIKEWKKKDCTARRILLSTIEEKLQNTLVGCKTAFQIWTRLATQHNKCASNNVYVIQRKFMNYDYQQGIFDERGEITTYTQHIFFYCQVMTPCLTSQLSKL